MADRIVQLTDKDNNNIFPVTQKTITMTDVDPGEGAALAADNYVAVYGGASSLIDVFYPVGSYYETSDTTFNPNIAWGGMWTEDSTGRVTVAQDSGTFATVGSTGGEETHQLVENELPKIEGTITMHSDGSATNIHAVGGHITAGRTNSQYKAGGDTASGANSQGSLKLSFGNNGAHNNLQPYIVVKRWHRVA